MKCSYADFLPRDAMRKRGLSVTFVNWQNENRILVIFSPSGIQTILVCSIPNAMAIFRFPTGTPLTGASNVGGVGTNCDFGLGLIAGYRSIAGRAIEQQLLRPLHGDASLNLNVCLSQPAT